MFLVDDLLLSPVKALMAIGRHIQEAAHQDLEDQEQAILTNLTELHRLIEAGQIGDDDFNTQETALLDRFDAIQKTLHPESNGPY